MGTFPPREITITIPHVTSIQFEGPVFDPFKGGVSKINGMDQFSGDDLNLEIGGVVKVDLDIEYNKLNVSIEGVSGVELKGSVQEQSLDIKGISAYRAFDLSSERCFVEINGPSTAEVQVSDLLDVVITGIGNVCYKGQPEINSDISTSGVLSNCN